MPPELQSAEASSRRGPTPAAPRGSGTDSNLARPIRVERNALPPESMVAPLGRAREEVEEPERGRAMVRIPAREIRVEPPAAPSPPQPSPCQVLTKDRSHPTGFPAEALTETRTLAHLSPPARDETLVSELKARTVPGKVRTSPREPLQWGQALLVTVHVIPWILLFAVVFRLVPAGWQFERWPEESQTVAGAAFGLFMLTDALVVLWCVAFRKAGRGVD